MEEETKDSTAATSQEQEKPPRTARNIVTVEDAGPCKKKVAIEIPEESIKEAFDEQYKELSREVVLPGFRKGRAPRRLLEKRFGKETNEQIKLKLLAEASEAAIKDKKLDILGDPDIDFEKVELPASGPMKFEFEAEVRPEFELPKLERIPVKRDKLEVTEEQIDREIEQLRRWSGVWTPREGGTVELDDQVIADVLLRPELTEEEKAKQAEAAQKAESGEEPQESQTLEAETKLDNIEVYVRPNGFVGAVPVEKLDELLVGTKVGDIKTTTVEVPKTYFREEYRGRKVDVSIEVKEIKHLRPAEINEQFLQRYNVESEAELRERIRDTLQERQEDRIRNDMSEQIYQYLLSNTRFDLPLDIVARQAGTILQRLYINLLQRGFSRQQIEEQMERLRASSEEQAKEQLKTFFIMDRVADKLEIEVTEEEINGHIAQLAIQRGQRPEKMKEQMERDGSLAQFRMDVRQNKCINKLLETADITEQEAPPAEDKPKRARKTAKKSAEDKAEKTDQ
ncbi:MAG TPA: trigger factor [Sedimentisphaerales bacterium]|nr:trigger factor [Sedimentisphaerales bacterium]HRS11600.1 trigger factor [Sedimentisphaerales bacterium]HRV48263.1 trigger factor [Sedimentisphaerales bacterium]